MQGVVPLEETIHDITQIHINGSCYNLQHKCTVTTISNPMILRALNEEVSYAFGVLSTTKTKALPYIKTL